MKKLFIILIVIISVFSCKKDDSKPKIELTCQGDCHSYTYKIGNESGSASSNFTTSYSYDSSGKRTKATSIGTITYQSTGNTYHISQVVNYQTCKYTVTVDGVGTCGN
jgi:hypothetical protein